MLGLSVKDLSPCAGLYKDKFTVLGNEVLQVRCWNYGSRFYNIFQNSRTHMSFYFSAVSGLLQHAGAYFIFYLAVTMSPDLLMNYSQFDFKKCTKEDRELLREYDSSLTLHMSSIRYVHTKRFLAETLAFLDHFIVLDTSLQVFVNLLSSYLLSYFDVDVLCSDDRILRSYRKSIIFTQ